MSVANRVALLVTGVLLLSGLAATAIFYESVRASLEADQTRALDARIHWLHEMSEVEAAEGTLAIRTIAEPPSAASYWRISLSGDRTLWQSNPAPEENMQSFSTVATFGEKKWPIVRSTDLQQGEASLLNVPEVIKQAARNALPGCTLRHVEDDENDGVRFYSFRANLRGQTYKIEIDRNGKFIGSDVLEIFEPIHFYFEGKKRIELQLTAFTPTQSAQAELNRLLSNLWTVGPFALVGTALLVVLLIRWQLRPLAQIARQATEIGPDSLALRILNTSSAAEYVALRAALNGMLERIDQGLQRERRFSSAAAHELRTPLAQLKTTIEVYRRRDHSAAEYRDAMDDLLADAERLERLIQGLLHLTRGSELLAANAKPVALCSLLTQSVAESGTAILHALPHDIQVTADPELLRAAIANVLSNALRYAPGVSPEIHVVDRPERVEVLVLDRGPGIPEAEWERIFQPLVRLDTARTVGNNADGLGLGLAIARSSVRAFGGDLICRARPDRESGAAFLFTLRKVLNN